MSHASRDLDDDLRELIRSIDGELVEVVPLESAGYPGYRPSAYRIRLADGRMVKGRRCGNWQRAAAVEYALQHIRHAALPRVLGRVGPTLLTEWLDGRPLTDADITPALLRRCGELLGAIHSTPLPERNPFERRDPIEDWHRRCERDLDELVEANVLTGSESRRALDLALCHAPNRCVAAFVHRDFCIENLVLQSDATICVADNETLGIDAREFDLGRTWYRWPMPPAHWEEFLAAYDARCGAHEFAAHITYWAIVALADAAVYRLRKHARATDVPIARLRTLLREVDRAAADPALLSC